MAVSSKQVDIALEIALREYPQGMFASHRECLRAAVEQILEITAAGIITEAANFIAKNSKQSADLSRDDYLTPREVRDRFRVSDMTLWRWVKTRPQGFPLPLRINRRRLWSRSAIEEWEKSRFAQGVS